MNAIRRYAPFRGTIEPIDRDAVEAQLAATEGD